MPSLSLVPRQFAALPQSNRADRRRAQKAEAREALNPTIGSRELSLDEIRSLTLIPVFSRGGQVKKVMLNRLAAPSGYAHDPVSMTLHTDRVGREFRVIHTQIVDLKGARYTEKRAERSKLKRAA